MATNQKQQYVALESWAGRTEHKIEVIRRGPKTSLCKWIDDGIKYKAGQKSRIPNHAIFTKE